MQQQCLSFLPISDYDPLTRKSEKVLGMELDKLIAIKKDFGLVAIDIENWINEEQCRCECNQS